MIPQLALAALLVGSSTVSPLLDGPELSEREWRLYRVWHKWEGEAKATRAKLDGCNEKLLAHAEPATPPDAPTDPGFQWTTFAAGLGIGGGVVGLALTVIYVTTQLKR